MELNFLDPEILSYWLKVLNPQTALIVGRVPIDYSEFGIKKVVKINQTHPGDVLKPFELAAQQIGRFYHIEPEKTAQAVSSFSLPASKIRFFPGLNNSIVIDATHYYFPIKLDSVFELVQDGTDIGRKIIFTHHKKDAKILKQYPAWLKNPKNFIPQNNDVIILRGNKTRIMQEFKHLFASHMPLI